MLITRCSDVRHKGQVDIVGNCVIISCLRKQAIPEIKNDK